LNNNKSIGIPVVALRTVGAGTDLQFSRQTAGRWYQS